MPFPPDIFSPREIENVEGVVYDEDKKTQIFAEDINAITGEIIDVENEVLDIADEVAALSSVYDYVIDSDGGGDFETLDALTSGAIPAGSRVFIKGEFTLTANLVFDNGNDRMDLYFLSVVLYTVGYSWKVESTCDNLILSGNIHSFGYGDVSLNGCVYYFEGSYMHADQLDVIHDITGVEDIGTELYPVQLRSATASEFGIFTFPAVTLSTNWTHQIALIGIYTTDSVVRGARVLGLTMTNNSAHCYGIRFENTRTRAWCFARLVNIGGTGVGYGVRYAGCTGSYIEGIANGNDTNTQTASNTSIRDEMNVY